MKKKHGFTLIELLAVIVILAIIALIATPMVLLSIHLSVRTCLNGTMEMKVIMTNWLKHWRNPVLRKVGEYDDEYK